MTDTEKINLVKEFLELLKKGGSFSFKYTEARENGLYIYDSYQRFQSLIPYEDIAENIHYVRERFGGK